MWIFTSGSFISVVADRDDPKKLLARARVDGHIEALFPAAKVLETLDADYRFRCTLNRKDVEKVVAKQVASINYDNFKGSIGDCEYHNACLDVWGTMYRLQGRAKPPYA